MVTKRTRLISGLVAILMLVSMFTAFVLPVTAETVSVPVGTSAETGLADANGLTDITQYTDGVNTYKVSDLAGMKKLAELVFGGNKLSGVTIYQAADIDMDGYPFAGIGSYAKPFSGVFDGNGFVIKSLYVIRNDEGATGAGLFGGISGATIKNVGVASGVVVGRNVTGGVVGCTLGNTTNNIINCWNAATVVGGGTNGTGGVVGRLYAGNQTVQNCYNVGLVFNNQNRAAGVVGWVEASTAINVINCYNAGEVALGFYGSYDNAAKYSAILSGDTAGAIGSSTANNYYVESRGTAGSMKDLKATLNDAGSKVEESALTDGTLAAALNGTGLTSVNNGWELSFKDSTAGYPTLAYTKKAAAEGEADVVIQRVAADNAVNVNNAQTWAQMSPLFATMVSKKNGTFASTAKLSDVRLKNANDLFALGMVTIATTYKTVFGNGNIYLDVDVDMDDQTLFAPIYSYVPICSGAGLFNGAFYGQKHVIYNWQYHSYWVDAQHNGGLFPLVNGAVISDLGMVDAVGTYQKISSSGNSYTYGALMVERVQNVKGSKVTMTNCFTTGELNIYPSMANINNYGGVFSTTWQSNSSFSKCWADVDVNTFAADGNKTTAKARVLGKIPDTYSTSVSNCYYLADEEPAIYKGEKDVTLNGQKYNIGVDNGAWYHLRNGRLPESNYSTEDGTLAIFLNQNNISSVTVKNGKTVFKNDGDEMYKVTLKLMVSGNDGYIYDERYYAPGETVTIPGTIDGYTYYYGDQEFKMPAEDRVIAYTAEGFDKELAEEIATRYGNGKFDFELFENGAAMKSAYEAAAAALAATDDATAIENLAKAVTFANQVGEPVLLMEEGYYPPYSQKSVYEALNPGSASTNYDWGISTREDWEAIAEEKNGNKNVTFDNYTFHFNNDVDMGGADGKTTTPINPENSGDFRGSFDGHGHKIENLNINWDVSKGCWVGLIGYGNRVIIRDLTIESGSVTAYGSNGSEHMVGAFIGEGYQCYVYNCVNKADVDASGVTKHGGQSVSGIGRLTGTSIIDSCINTGDISAKGYAYGISAYTQGATYVVNSYTTGKLTGGHTGLARYNNSYDRDAYYVNSYIIDNEFCTVRILLNEDQYELNSEEIGESDLAGLLNYNYVSLDWRKNALGGNNTRTYFTVNEDGETVYVNDDNPYRTVTVAMECEGHETKYLYGEKDDVVTPNYSENATYKLKTSGTYDAATNELTLGTSDVTLTVYTNDPLTDQLEEAMADFEGANLDVYETEGVDDFATFVAEVEQKLAEGGYTTQAEIDADLAKINAAVLKDGFIYPRVSRKTLTSANLVVTNLADLEQVYIHRSQLTNAKTIHLAADIEVPEGSVANNMYGLNANINGHGHTIKGVAFSGLRAGSTNEWASNGWLTQYTGTSIKNLTLDGWSATGLPWLGALLIGEYSGTGLTIENVKVTNSLSESGNLQNGLGLLVGYIGNASSSITFKNVELDGNVVDGATKGNIGILLGRVANGAKIVADGVSITNNTLKGSGTWGKSYLIGEGTGKLTLKNITVRDNNVAEGSANTAVLIGTFKGSGNSLTMSNVVAYNNGSYPLINAGDAAATQTINDATVYTDATRIMSGSVTINTTADTADMATGLAAATMNTTYGSEVWTTKDGIAVQLAFDEDAVPMTKVTFKAAEVGYPIMEESKGTTTLYADSDGKLLNLESIKDELNKRGIWNWDAIAAATYGADNNVVYGTPIPAHEHDFTYVQGEGEHTASCEWKNGVVECPWTVTEECEYTESVTCDNKDAAPGEATHSGTCVCGQTGESVKCDLTVTVTKKATCDEAGSQIHVCDDCGYYFVETIAKREHDYTEFEADTNEDGTFTGIHSKHCKHTDPDCTNTVSGQCSYTGEWVTVTEPTTTTEGEERRYCDEDCGSYETRPIPALPYLEAEAELGYLGETMEVLVDIKNNPGISGAVLDITYDPDVVDLTGAELVLDDDNTREGNWTVPEEFGKQTTADGLEMATISLAGYDPDNYVGESFLKLSFKVVDDATKVGTHNLAISIPEKGTADYELNFKEIAAWTGEYKVVDIMLGDVDRDRSVTIADAILMLKKLNGVNIEIDKEAADVYGDNSLDPSDVVRVLQYLNHMIADFD